MIYNYDELAKNFNQALLVKLRKHGVEEAFLDFWVPDENPLIGILSMIDSAQIAKLKEIKIRVNESTLDINGWNILKVKLTKDYQGEVKLYDKYRILEVNLKNNEIKSADKNNAPKIESRVINDAEIIERYKNKIELTPEQFKPKLSFGENISTEFKDKKIDQSNLTVIKASSNILTFALCLDSDGKVTDASYTSSIELNTNPLELCCRFALGLPIQEVADHLVLKLIDYFNDEINSSNNTIRGIKLPSNTAREFVELQKILRRIFDLYLKNNNLKSKVNFYFDQIPDFWNKLEAGDKNTLINKLINEYVSENNLSFGSIRLVKLERNKYKQDVRFAISIDNSVNLNEKPKIMRNLESYLRKKIFKQVELIAERVQDVSPLRRLTKEDLRRSI